jgi:hypothetical protein
VRTVLDMDEKIVALAKLKASEQGKSLDALVEDGLRLALQMPARAAESGKVQGDALDSDDPFFSALADIRNLGRPPAKSRAIQLNE